MPPLRQPVGHRRLLRDGHRANLLRHAVPIHHRAGAPRRLLQVARGAGRLALIRAVVEQLRLAAAERLADARLEVRFRKESRLVGPVHRGVAAEPSPSHDGHVDRRGPGQAHHERVTGFVARGALEVRGAVPLAHRDALECLRQQLVVHRPLMAQRQHRGFREHALQVRDRRARRLHRDPPDHRLAHGLLLSRGKVGPQVVLALIGRWQLDLDHPPEPARQGAVQLVREVRRGHDDHRPRGRRAESIHLREELIQRHRLAVPGEAGSRLVAAPPDGVDLIDEDDARRVPAGAGEQRPDVFRTTPHILGDEVAARVHEEGTVGLARQCSRQQRLPGAGRSRQQHTLRRAHAGGGELLRLAQPLAEGPQRLLGPGRPDDVVEPGRRTLHLRHDVRRVTASPDGRHLEVAAANAQLPTGQRRRGVEAHRFGLSGQVDGDPLTPKAHRFLLDRRHESPRATGLAGLTGVFAHQVHRAPSTPRADACEEQLLVDPARRRV